MRAGCQDLPAVPQGTGARRSQLRQVKCPHLSTTGPVMPQCWPSSASLAQEGADIRHHSAKVIVSGETESLTDSANGLCSR